MQRDAHRSTLLHNRTRSAAGAALVAALALAACSKGGGDDGSDVTPADEPGIGLVLSSTGASPELGGLLHVASEDIERNGLSLDVPAAALAQATTLSVGTIDAWPAQSAFGQQPVGQAFVFEPHGTAFAKSATLTLPVPPADAAQALHVGRWHAATATWESLGGARDGDFIQVELEHLSTYALLYSGKSLVAVRNAGPERIELRHVSGPAMPAGHPEGQPFPAYRPLPHDGIEVDAGATRSLMLLPGSYHFVVSYPSPQPGVANSLFLTIPELAAGADDASIDQTLTITPEGATSDEPGTQASIQFAGASVVPGSNLRPLVSIDADAPVNVPVVDALTGGPVTPETRVVNVGPIKAEELTTGALVLSGTATDPEGHSPLHVAWTWSFGTLPTHHFIQNGSTDSASFLPNPRREGLYTIWFTAYDELGLWDEGRWNILVEPNTRPTLRVIADDFIVDFGRLDVKRRPFGALPISGPVPGVCDYVDTDGDGLVDTTVLKTLPAGPTESNPDQDPTSMSCVFAIVFDADGDPLSGGFQLPTPIFGRGTVYAAIPVPGTPALPAGLAIGEIIDTYPKMAAYNAELLFQAAMGALPVDATIFPGEPAGAQALPILWEAPDDPDTPTDSTNDCSEFAGCGISNGGTVNLSARISDGFSTQRTDFTTLGYPDDDVNLLCQIQSVTPSPVDPGPGQGVTVTACLFPANPGVPIHFAITGSDGYSNEATNLTDDEGCAGFFIPGGAEGVSDHVVVTCGSSMVVVDYVF